MARFSDGPGFSSIDRIGTERFRPSRVEVAGRRGVFSGGEGSVPSSRKVLIVEDERLIAEYFRIVVEHIGYEICGIAGSADEAIDLAERQDPDVVLMDVRLSGDKDGVYAAEEIFRHRPLPIIYITASKEPATMLRIRENHPVEILIKPVVQQQLREVLARHAPLPD